MVKRPQRTETVTIKIVQADPDGTWIVQTTWHSQGKVPLELFAQIRDSAHMILDPVAAHQLHNAMVDSCCERLT